MSAPRDRTRVAILSIGNEVCDGRILNTNAPWLSYHLLEQGLLPDFVTSCRDSLEEICDVLEFLSTRVDFIITSGGLGPTSDDLTRQAVASFVHQDLELDECELAKLKNYYKQRGRKFDNANSIQAHFPKGARVIPNPVGTAPGFIVEYKQGEPSTLIYSLPGVPIELKEMTAQTVLPDILSHLPERPSLPHAHYFHLFGIPESEVGKTLQRLEIPSSVYVGYRPHFPEVEVRIESLIPQDLEAASDMIRGVVESYIYAESKEGGLPRALHSLLVRSKKTIAVAESCTGGLVGKLLTEESGSSSFFLGGYLTYSNDLKMKLLHVPAEVLEEQGAVSPEVAVLMAKGALSETGADFGLSITGIAGPDGGSEAKPVGLFYVGIATVGYSVAIKFFFPHNREYVRRYAAYAALDSVRRYLLGMPFLGTIAS